MLIDVGTRLWSSVSVDTALEKAATSLRGRGECLVPAVMSHDDRRLPEGGVVVGKGKPHMLHLFTCKSGETGYTGSRFCSRLETHRRLLSVHMVNDLGKGGKLHMSYALGIPVPLDRFSDDVVTLRRCFVQLCDGDHCAALLLDHFYERATIREEYIMYAEGTCGREPVPDRWIATSISQLQAKLSDLFDEQRLYEALRLLAKKTFAAIRVDITEGDVPYCCSSNTINKVLSALAGIPFQEVPLEEQLQGTHEAAPRQPARTRQELPLEKKYKTEAARVAYQCKRALALGLPARLPVEQWLTTLNHFEWKCAYCKGPYRLLEHFIPLVHGGGTISSNCVPSCTRCNGIKGTGAPAALPPSAQEQIESALQTIQAYLETRIYVEDE